jgi:hypothetical protein
MRHSITFIGAALVLLATSSAFAQSPSGPPDHFTIDIVQVIGSGCGSPTDYAVSISADKTAFTVGYANYAVYSGIDPATNRTHKLQDNRKNCLIGVRVNVPGGFTFGIAEADMRGYMSLRPRSNPVAITSFWFQGLAPTMPISHVLRNNAFDMFGNPVSFPLGTDTVDFVSWQTTDITPIASLIYNPCGAQRNLNVNTQLQVNPDANAPESVAGADATDGSIQTTFHFAWATCP